jgi:hypothetical protein
MKSLRILLLAAAALLFSGFAHADWTTAGLLTNPAIDTILADTGPAPTDGGIRGKMFMASTVQAVGVLEWRNAANTANIRSQAFVVPANSSLQIMLEFPLNMSTGERLRVRLNAAITGVVQASMFSDMP